MRNSRQPFSGRCGYVRRKIRAYKDIRKKEKGLSYEKEDILNYMDSLPPLLPRIHGIVSVDSENITMTAADEVSP